MEDGEPAACEDEVGHCKWREQFSDVHNNPDDNEDAWVHPDPPPGWELAWRMSGVLGQQLPWQVIEDMFDLDLYDKIERRDIATKAVSMNSTVQRLAREHAQTKAKQAK